MVTIPHRLAIATLAASVLAPPAVHAQQTLRLFEAPAAAEVLACTEVLLFSEEEAEAEQALAAADVHLLSEARRLGVARVGIAFLRALASTADHADQPTAYDYCLPVDQRPTGASGLNLTFRDLPARRVQVAFCRSSDTMLCRQDLERQAPRAGGLAPAPGAQPATVRIAPWRQTVLPTARVMVETVQALQPVRVQSPAPSGTGAAVDIPDTDLRPFGAPPSDRAGAAQPLTDTVVQIPGLIIMLEPPAP